MPIQKQSWSAGDEMTSAKLNNTGFISFSGDGSDGALNISSGTTTVDCSNEPIVHLNYTSVSITGTAKLAFSNPYSGGTTIILTSQGDVTLTSSDLAMIDASGMGASAQTNASNILDALQHYGSHGDNGQGSGSEGGVAFTNLSFYTRTPYQVLAKRSLSLSPGSGGGTGSDNWTGSPIHGTGGKGGGVLVIECNGAFNFPSGGISVAGANGVTADANGSGASGTFWGSSGGGGAGSFAATGGDGGINNQLGLGGGGGGGAAGQCVIVANIITSQAGTINSKGGDGGNSTTDSTYQAGGGGGGASATNNGSDGTIGLTGLGGAGGASTGGFVIKNYYYN